VNGGLDVEIDGAKIGEHAEKMAAERASVAGGIAPRSGGPR